MARLQLLVALRLSHDNGGSLPWPSLGPQSEADSLPQVPNCGRCRRLQPCSRPPPHMTMAFAAAAASNTSFSAEPLARAGGSCSVGGGCGDSIVSGSSGFRAAK